jgi:hypothetical protein
VELRRKRKACGHSRQAEARTSASQPERPPFGSKRYNPSEEDSVKPVLSVVLLALTGCAAHKPSGPAAVSPPANGHVEVSDGIEDTLTDPRVARSPDLVRGTADVARGNITFTIRFAPGTFNRSTIVGIQLDTDQNPQTGIRNVNGLGVDYSINMGASLNGNQARIFKAMPTPAGACPATGPCYEQVGTAPVTFAEDGVNLTVPLALLGNNSGRLDFRIAASGQGTAILDLMPDYSLPPARVGNPPR